jgi:beta-lactamase class A
MRLSLSLLLCALAFGQMPAADLLEQKTIARIRAVDEALDGVLGVAAIDLTTGRTLTWHADALFATASSIKIPIMIEVFRQAGAGTLRLDQTVPLTSKDLVDGSARLEKLLAKGPASATVRELVEAMIEVSDNSATNKLIALAGMDQVNRTLGEIGFPNTRLRRRMMEWATARTNENVSTPLEMARLAELIYRGKAVDEAASAEMLKIMKRVQAGFRRAIPAGIEVAAKPGEIPGARCETGIVLLPNRPFALAVMSAFVPDNKDPVPEIAALVYSHFEKLARSNQWGHRLE